MKEVNHTWHNRKKALRIRMIIICTRTSKVCIEFCSLHCESCGSFCDSNHSSGQSAVALSFGIRRVEAGSQCGSCPYSCWPSRSSSWRGCCCICSNGAPAPEPAAIKTAALVGGNCGSNCGPLSGGRGCRLVCCSVNSSGSGLGIGFGFRIFGSG